MLKVKFLIASSLIVLTLWGLVSLGFWQLSRADEKRQIEAQIINAQTEPAELDISVTSLLKKEHYPVLLKGQYVSSKQFIYDNQIVNSTAGYFVLTPFLLHGSKDVILVNRGFVPWNGKRNVTVPLDVSTEELTIKVNIKKQVERQQLIEATLNTGFPLLIQAINFENLNKVSALKIIPMLALLDVKEKNGFYRKWQPFYGSVEKHIGYAIQWFAMAFVLLIIAVRLLYIKINKFKRNVSLNP